MAFWKRKRPRDEAPSTSTFVAMAEVWEFLVTRLGYKSEDVKAAAMKYGELYKWQKGPTTQLAILKKLESILKQNGAQPRA